MKIIRESFFIYHEGICVIRKDCQSMYFMSTRFLKDNIYGVHVLKFQLAYIRDTTNPSHENVVKLCREVNYMWWENQDLEQ